MAKVSEIMSPHPQVIGPEDTLQRAARMMQELDVGALPVCNGKEVLGMLTDRDIAIRGVAKGLSPDAEVRAVMSDEIRYCFEDDEADDVLANMGEIQVRRLPVMNHDKRLVGVVSISDLAGNGEEMQAGEALCEIARPSRLHSQMA